ncbi:MAG TPA: sigma-70 family RNA polymerase sigma factor [Symbiobacteriaceae bacterium]|nr:sigma-70 family RNA polymerase sigma factor [Symbiobacteriaceae bacterium]
MELSYARAPGVDAAAREQALQRLVEAHGNTVLHLAYMYLKDRDLAEDVFQEVFTRVYLQLHTFRGEASPKTWICRITVNLCRDKLRSWTARRVLLMGEDLLRSMAGGAEETEDAVLAEADRGAVMEAIMRLPMEYREAVLLYYYEEMDTKEVATALGLSEGTLRSRLHRARARLKALLMEGGFGRHGA